MSSDASKSTCFRDMADKILVQPATADDLEQLIQLPDTERNAIAFVIACWCGHCWKCVDKINALFAHLVKAEQVGQKGVRPVVLVFDADVYTHPINALIQDSAHHINAYPSIVFFKGNQIQLYVPGGPRDPESLLAAWNQL